MMSSYESWVERNQAWVLPLVDTSRSLTMFLPGRLNANEVRTEATYTLFNLITLYHNRILDRSPSASIQGFYSCQLKCANETSGTKRAKTILSVFHYTEVCLEMMITQLAHARLKSTAQAQRVKWIGVLAIEVIKSLCKLFLLIKNKGRMLLMPSNEELERLTLTIKGEKYIKELNESEHKHPYRDILEMYAQHGRAGHPHGIFSPPPEHPRDRSSYCPSKTAILAELLYIFRPCLYVAGVMLNGLTSWRPYFLSLFVDILARILVGRSSALSPCQSQEVVRRLMGYGYYLVRDPFFSRFTKLPLTVLVEGIKKLPLIGPILGMISELLISLQQHYFYTSASSAS